ncbi:hypothetical protein E2C01_079905 [Portunus trituberculatus]|uniref:Uncharacterized protein n=1 Tax=Portunus trituberculatus TaxID=210409 RepID=A0A5B7IY64_PORTR|nr:hypothetical protein [Portunus trituberculatus]
MNTENTCAGVPTPGDPHSCPASPRRADSHAMEVKHEERSFQFRNCSSSRKCEKRSVTKID